MTIELLKHQENIIEYLEKRCINQKGLLLYHGMGTGKTISGLGWIQYRTLRSTKENYIIVCPEFITLSWINDSRKIGFEIKESNIISYKSFRARLLSNKINFENLNFIFDEAHHLCSILKENNFMLYSNFLKKIRSSSGKILLLTGTPMYESKFDISILLNICSEGNNYPVDKFEFIKKYQNKSIVNSKKKSWIFNLVKPLLAYGGLKMITFIPEKIFFFKTVAGKKIHNKMISGTDSLNELKFSQTIKIIQEIITIILKNLKTIVSFTIISVIVTLIIFKLLRYFTITGDLKTALQQVPIDYKHFVDDSSQYIDYHWNELDDNNSDFARRMETKFIKSRFDLFQCQLCAKFFYGTLDSSFISFILNKEEDEVFTKSELFKSYDYFIKYARCLSNLSPYAKKIIEHKATFSVDVHNGSVSLNGVSKKEILNDTCSKFIKLGEQTQINLKKKERVFIYSEFDIQGGYLISCYLKALGIRHVYLNSDLTLKNKSKALDEFNELKYDLIILDYNCSEGINLVGIEHVYLLEPTNNNSLQEQIIYRAIRYKSHNHLPIERRQVTPYICLSEIVTRNEQTYFGLSKEYFITKKHSIMANIQEIDDNYKGILPRTGVSLIDIVLNRVWCLNEPALNAVTSPDTLCIEEIKKSHLEHKDFIKFLKINNVNSKMFKIPQSCNKITSKKSSRKKSLHKRSARKKSSH